MGKFARIKCSPHVLSKFSNNLNDALKWTPIYKVTVYITLTTVIKYKRLQFPIAPAAAITVHKSQGATFENIVYDYDKGQQKQLVYVALSRVTDIKGLYLTNANNVFKFFHAAGFSKSTIKDIQDEYARLESHNLPTLIANNQQFISESNNGTNSNQVIHIATINAQSLAAHSSDIETDKILI